MTWWLTAAAYALGSISFAAIAAGRAGVDLRQVGSGNLGATNVGRALGKRAGRVVLVLDALKGLVPVALARVLTNDARTVTLVGLAAVVGHVLPVWHRFRGGKGAATGLGVMLGASPIVGAAGAIGYVIGKRIALRASVGSLLGATLALALAWSVPRICDVPWLVTGVWCVVAVAHRDNIVRLLRGTEPKS